MKRFKLTTMSAVSGAPKKPAIPKKELKYDRGKETH